MVTDRNGAARTRRLIQRGRLCAIPLALATDRIAAYDRYLLCYEQFLAPPEKGLDILLICATLYLVGNYVWSAGPCLS